MYKWEESVPFPLVLMVPSVVTVLLGGMGVLLILVAWSQRSHSALDVIPGPKLLPFIADILIKLATNSFNSVSMFQKLGKKYGGIYKIQHGLSTVVCISKPEYLQVFYASKANVNRGLYYDDIASCLGDCLFVAGGEKWKMLRELAITSFFSTPSDALLPFLVSEVDWMINKFRQKADGSFFSSEPIIRDTLLRSLSQSLLGEPVSNEMIEQFQKLPRNMKLIMRRQIDFRYYFNLVFQMTSAGRTMARDVEENNKYLTNLVRKYRARLKEYEDCNQEVPDLYIYKMLMKSTGSDADIAAELRFLQVAAFDTTSGAMSYVLECLGQNADVQQKVFEEDSAILATLGTRQLSVTDLNQYKYLDRVIKESLRMFPVGPLISRKTSEDTYLGKYLIPKSTTIMAQQITCNYDEEIFKNPTKFDPDRFLPENSRQIPQYAFNPFSAGPRGCLGMRYANMSMKIYLSAIVRNFKIHPGYSSLEEALKNSDCEVTLKDKNEHPIRLISRL